MKHIQIIVGLGILVNEKGEILITQRFDPSNPRIHLKWQLPGGGVEFGETVEEAVIREMKEEVDVDVTLLDAPPVVATSLWTYPDKKMHCVLIGFLCQADGQSVRITCSETGEFAWIRPEKISSYDCLPKAREFIEKAAMLLNQQ